ncbi:PhnD/SsuA/transferrin family substrate-binding protein [Thioalkalivibrio denitrificans]|nr:PhnD/SsuA/transferrin family substrate-binding protein [Thioalkalivibrio denitrificans]
MNASLNRLVRSGLLVLVAWLGMGQVAAQGPLVLTAAPRENPEQGMQLYGPLAQRMSEALGREVQYRHPGNWLAYQRDMRNEVFDIVLDGPHLIAWRIHEIDHAPLARMPGQLMFVVIVPETDTSIQSLDDLVARRVCAVAPPNLAPLVLLSQYPNTIRQPMIHPARRGMQQAFEQFRAGECVAAALPAGFYNNILSDEDREGTRILFRSEGLPQQGFTAGPRVDEQGRQALRELLTTDGEQSTAPLLRRFAGDATRLIPVAQGEYDPHYLLLKGVIFGW